MERLLFSICDRFSGTRAPTPLFLDRVQLVASPQPFEHERLDATPSTTSCLEPRKKRLAYGYERADRETSTMKCFTPSGESGMAKFG
jgi:hypothetical protein